MFDMKTAKNKSEPDSNENILDERLSKIRYEFENNILEEVACQSLAPIRKPYRLHQSELPVGFDSSHDDSHSLFLCLKLENDRLKNSLFEMDGKCRKLQINEDRHMEDLEIYKQRNEKLMDVCVMQHDKLTRFESKEGEDRTRDELHKSIDEQVLPCLKQAIREIEYFRECCEAAYNNLKAKRSCNINASVNELCTQNMKFLEDQIVLCNKKIADLKQKLNEYSSSALKGHSLSILDIIETIKVCVSTFLNQYIAVLVALIKEKDCNNNLSSINNILDGNVKNVPNWEAGNSASASQLDPTRPPFVPIFNPTTLPIPFFGPLYKFPPSQAQPPMNRPPNMMPQVVPSWIPIRTNMYSCQQVPFFSPTIRRPPQPTPQSNFQLNDNPAFFQQPRNPQPPPMTTFQQPPPPVPLPPTRPTKTVHDRILKAKQATSPNATVQNDSVKDKKPNDALINTAVPKEALPETKMTVPKKAVTKINAVKPNDAADKTVLEAPAVFEFKAQPEEDSCLKSLKLDKARKSGGVAGDVFAAFENQIFWPNFNDKVEAADEEPILTKIIESPMPIISKNTSPLSPVDLFKVSAIKLGIENANLPEEHKNKLEEVVNKQDYLEGGKYHQLYNSIKDQINYSADDVIACLERVRIENGGKMSFLTRAVILEKVQSMMSMNTSNICMICRLNTPSCQSAHLWCGHVFHKNCITEWLKTKVLCPVCRTHINLDNITAAQW